MKKDLLWDLVARQDAIEIYEQWGKEITMRLVPGQWIRLGGLLGHGCRLTVKGRDGHRRKHLGDAQLGDSVRQEWPRNAVFLKMTGARTEARPTKGVGDPRESLGTTIAQHGAYTNTTVTRFVSLERCVHHPTQTWSTDMTLCSVIEQPGQHCSHGAPTAPTNLTGVWKGKSLR